MRLKDCFVLVALVCVCDGTQGLRAQAVPTAQAAPAPAAQEAATTRRRNRVEFRWRIIRFRRATLIRAAY